MGTQKKGYSEKNSPNPSKEATSEGVTSKPWQITHSMISIQHDAVCSKATFGASEVAV